MKERETWSKSLQELLAWREECLSGDRVHSGLCLKRNQALDQWLCVLLKVCEVHPLRLTGSTFLPLLEQLVELKLRAM